MAEYQLERRGGPIYSLCVESQTPKPTDLANVVETRARTDRLRSLLRGSDKRTVSAAARCRIKSSRHGNSKCYWQHSGDSIILHDDAGTPSRLLVPVGSGKFDPVNIPWHHDVCSFASSSFSHSRNLLHARHSGLLPSLEFRLSVRVGIPGAESLSRPSLLQEVDYPGWYTTPLRTTPGMMSSGVCMCHLVSSISPTHRV